MTHGAIPNPKPDTAPSDSVDRQLLCAIHDVSPRFDAEIERLVEQFHRHLPVHRFAMLVVPDYWGEAPLSAFPDFQRKLRRWSEAGVEIFVHGWLHRDVATHRGAASVKAKWMTAGEGEFLGLSHRDSLTRMRNGRKLIADICGKAPTGFIAPAWLYGPGAQSALAEAGFTRAEDHMRVWNPQNGAILAKGPVITWASRSLPRRLSSYAVAAAARTVLHRQRIIRVGVHPGDTHMPHIMRSIDRTLERFTARRAVGQYAGLAHRGTA